MEKRLFVAIPLSGAIKKELLGVRDEVRVQGIRWTDGNNLHITLHFIGGVEEGNIDRLSLKLAETLKGTKQFSLFLESIEFGPPAGKPHMIWALFKDGGGAYGALARSIAESLKEYSGDTMKRPIPHVTLARFNDPGIARGISLGQVRGTELNVDRVKLMESRLHPQGPEYSVVKEYLL